MSLTATDLHDMRIIIQEELKVHIDPLSGRIEALENDVKEIYYMLLDSQGLPFS